MQKEKRGKNKATISVTGRDLPEQCIQIERSANCTWDFVKSDVDLFDKPKDKILDKIVPFVSACKVWQGTATQLIEETKLDITPNVMKEQENTFLLILTVLPFLIKSDSVG